MKRKGKWFNRVHAEAVVVVGLEQPAALPDSDCLNVSTYFRRFATGAACWAACRQKQTASRDHCPSWGESWPEIEGVEVKLESWRTARCPARQWWRLRAPCWAKWPERSETNVEVWSEEGANQGSPSTWVTSECCSLGDCCLRPKAVHSSPSDTLLPSDCSRASSPHWLAEVRGEVKKEAVKRQANWRFLTCEFGWPSKTHELARRATTVVKIRTGHATRSAKSIWKCAADKH